MPMPTLIAALNFSPTSIALILLRLAGFIFAALSVLGFAWATRQRRERRVSEQRRKERREGWEASWQGAWEANRSPVAEGVTGTAGTADEAPATASPPKPHPLRRPVRRVMFSFNDRDLEPIEKLVAQGRATKEDVTVMEVMARIREVERERGQEEQRAARDSLEDW